MFTFTCLTPHNIAMGVENGKLFVCGYNYFVTSVVKSLESMECFLMSLPVNNQTNFLMNGFFDKLQIEQDQFWSRLFGSHVFTLHSPSLLQSAEILKCSHSVASTPLDSDTNFLFFSKPFPVSCYFMIRKASRFVKLSTTDVCDIERKNAAGSCVDYSIGCLRGKKERGVFFVCFD